MSKRFHLLACCAISFGLGALSLPWLVSLLGKPIDSKEHCQMVLERFALSEKAINLCNNLPGCKIDYEDIRAVAVDHSAAEQCK